jgi:hypothetical protein
MPAPPTLLTIAPDLVLSIAEQLSLQDLHALVRCNRLLYHLLLRFLYHRAIVTRPPCYCRSLGRPTLECVDYYSYPKAKNFWKGCPWLENARQVKLCLAAGMDVNMNLYCYSTCTRLQLAARNLDAEWNSEEEEVMRVLLAHGADVNSATKSGESPLLLGVAKNNLKMVTLLLDHRADANLVDGKGKLPLHYAVTYPSCEMVACLLKHGANPNLWSGRSPLQDAIHGHKTCNGRRRQRREFVKIIRLLVKAGALVEMLGEQDRDSVKTILERHSLPTPALVPAEPTETNTISLP